MAMGAEGPLCTRWPAATVCGASMYWKLPLRSPAPPGTPEAALAPCSPAAHTFPEAKWHACAPSVTDECRFVSSSCRQAPAWRAEVNVGCSTDLRFDLEKARRLPVHNMAANSGGTGHTLAPSPYFTRAMRAPSPYLTRAMRAVRLGSYSMRCTTPCWPALTPPKSTFRSSRLWPPPRCHAVTLRARRPR